MRGSLVDRFLAKVGEPDERGCWPWLGAMSPSGYGVMGLGGRALGTVSAHRASWILHHGDSPECDLDHACGNRGCVNPGHLRPASRVENSQHRTALNRNNTSGFQGVYLHACGRWAAEVHDQGVKRWAGLHDTPEQAGDAARRLRLILFTHNDADKGAAR